MPGKPDIVMFRFTRGEEYGCDVIVTNKEIFSFANAKYPKDTPTDVIEQLYEDAEKAAINQIEKLTFYDQHWGGQD